MIFKTKRLIIRYLTKNDCDSFFEMMSNPNVMNPIPQEIRDRKTSDHHFEKHLNAKRNSDIKVWAIDTNNGETFVGIAAYLKNDKNEDEIGYRLREKFWGIGYGSEIAEGLINYGFNILNVQLITADVNMANEKSVKILEKFFETEFKFYNPNDKCTDRRYKITKQQWANHLKI